MLALTSLAHRDPPAHAAHVCGPYPADLPKATKKVSCSCVRLLATAESLTAVTQTSGQHELHTEIQTCQTGLLSLTFLAQMASAQADSQWGSRLKSRRSFYNLEREVISKDNFNEEDKEKFFANLDDEVTERKLRQVWSNLKLSGS
ncbi:unnamed protein product [Durusdinium trenchii]|uniref:Uncharacterized protein n=1 Tax=Durusdinium trenchii TaxID=1381693 RepID=A0ABP0J3Z6_9DINO